ncbi:MAG TPA: hypothetical protein VIH61_07080 [Waddliaceae bacterium]
MKIILISILLLRTLVSCQTLCKQEVLLHQTIHSHAKIQKKIYGLALIGSGGSIPDHQVKEFIVHYVANRPMSLDEARNLYVHSVEGLLNLINSNDELKPYLDNYPFTVNNLDLKISYWDPNADGFDPPSVALVFLVRGNICYAYYDNQSARFTYEMDIREPYLEARRIVLGDDASTNCFNNENN